MCFLANTLVCFFCRDIFSISNVLTSEFQSAILLKCQDETEQSLVDYLCHGQGLLLLHMLYILASKVITQSLYTLYVGQMYHHVHVLHVN